MATTYDKANSDVTQLVKAVAAEFHAELVRYEVSIDVLMANNPDGDAVTHGGYPAQAKIRIVSLKDRAKGCKDAELIIDESNWRDLTDEQRRALIDHELQHLEVKFKDGGVALDDLGRPKLSMRKHDWQMGWFDVIARRHGEASPEVRQASELMGRQGQLYFGFAADDGAMGIDSVLKAAG